MFLLADMFVKPAYIFIGEGGGERRLREREREEAEADRRERRDEEIRERERRFSCMSNPSSSAMPYFAALGG